MWSPDAGLDIVYLSPTAQAERLQWQLGWFCEALDWDEEDQTSVIDIDHITNLHTINDSPTATDT